MTKTMTNIEMVQAVNGLSEFVKKDKVVPIALSVAISANIKNLIRELEPYEEQRKIILAGKQGEMDKKFKELYEIGADVAIRMVKQNIIDVLELSTRDYMTLEFMIEPESRSE